MLYPPELKKLQLKPQIFRKMKNLRLLTIRNVHCYGHLEYLPSGLKLLDWHKYPFPSLPSDFCPKNLVVLDMAGNQLKKTFKQVWSFIFFLRINTFFFFLSLKYNLIFEFYFIYRFLHSKP